MLSQIFIHVPEMNLFQPERLRRLLARCDIWLPLSVCIREKKNTAFNRHPITPSPSSPVVETNFPGGSNLHIWLKDTRSCQIGWTDTITSSEQKHRTKAQISIFRTLSSENSVKKNPDSGYVEARLSIMAFDVRWSGFTLPPWLRLERRKAKALHCVLLLLLLYSTRWGDVIERKRMRFSDWRERIAISLFNYGKSKGNATSRFEVSIFRECCFDVWMCVDHVLIDVPSILNCLKSRWEIKNRFNLFKKD